MSVLWNLPSMYTSVIRIFTKLFIYNIKCTMKAHSRGGGLSYSPWRKKWMMLLRLTYVPAPKPTNPNTNIEMFFTSLSLKRKHQ